ncbi:MAG: cysteine desulfurase family protein [Clostridia bacterium]
MIYLDNSATTKMDNDACKVYLQTNQQMYLNPSAPYSFEVKQKLENARKAIASKINATPEQIIFTASATEANNLAILGSRKSNSKFLFSSAEHPSVFEITKHFKIENTPFEFINLLNDGLIDESDYLKKLNNNPTFISCCYVCSENGALNNIKQLVNIKNKYNKSILFHTDATQAFGKIEIDVMQLGVDFLTFSAHKIHGPKGLGVLYVKYPQKLKSLIFGGGQEFGLRSGTENFPAILAFETVVKNLNIKQNFKNVSILKNKFIKNLTCDYIKNIENDFPYIISIAFPNVKAETFQRILFERGVCVGTGSACSSKKEGNRVLQSMGISKKQITESLRISFSIHNTIKEINTATTIICEEYLKLLHKVKK